MEKCKQNSYWYCWNIYKQEMVLGSFDLAEFSDPKIVYWIAIEVISWNHSQTQPCSDSRYIDKELWLVIYWDCSAGLDFFSFFVTGLNAKAAIFKGWLVLIFIVMIFVVRLENYGLSSISNLAKFQFTNQLAKK